MRKFLTTVALVAALAVPVAVGTVSRPAPVAQVASVDTYGTGTYGTGTYGTGLARQANRRFKALRRRARHAHLR